MLLHQERTSYIMLGISRRFQMTDDVANSPFLTYTVLRAPICLFRMEDHRGRRELQQAFPIIELPSVVQFCPI
jgi:hypothetical protein